MPGPSRLCVSWHLTPPSSLDFGVYFIGGGVIALHTLLIESGPFSHARRNTRQRQAASP